MTWGAAALVVLLGVGVYLRSRVGWEHACTLAKKQLPGLLGMDVSIDRCEIDPVRQSVRLYGVSATPRGATEPMLEFDWADARLRSISPFLGRIRLDTVTIERLRVRLDLSAAGHENRAELARRSCRLDALASVEIDRMEVRRGELRLHLPEQREVELQGLELEWDGRRQGAEVRVEGRDGVVRLPAPHRELLVGALAVEASLDLDEPRVEIARAEVAIDGSTLNVSGDIDQLCDPQLALDAQLFLPLQTVAHLTASKEKMDGHVWTRASVSGRPGTPLARVEVVGSAVKVGSFSPGDFRAQAAYADGVVELTELSARAGPGTARATGTVKLGPGLPTRLELKVDNAEFGPILAAAGLPGSWVDFLATGQGTLEGTLLPAPRLQGNAEVRVGRFAVASRAYDAPASVGSTLLSFSQGRAAGRLAVLGDRVELTSMVVDSGRSRATGNATLYYDVDRGLAIHARGEALDLSDFGRVAGVTWAGLGAGEVEIAGPYTAPQISGRVHLRDFVLWDLSLGVIQGPVHFSKDLLSFPGFSGQKGHTPYFGQAALDFAAAPRMKLTVDVPAGGRTEDLVDVIVGLDSSIELFQGPLVGDASGKAVFDGPLEALDGRIDLAFKDTRYYDRRLGAGKVGLRIVDGETMLLEPTTLVGPFARISVEGSWAFAGPLDYRFRFDGVPVAELFEPGRPSALGFSGNLTLVGKVSGDTKMPVVTAYLTAPAVGFAGRGLGATHLEGRIAGKDLQVWGRPFDDARVIMKMRLKEPFPYEGKVTLALPEIRPLLPVAAIRQGVSGALAGTAQASGNLRNARSVRATATVEKLALGRGEFGGRNESPIGLTYENGRLDVEPFVFRGPNTDLSAAGWVGPSHLDFHTHGTLDFRMIESFLPQLERTAGRVALTVAATGPLKDPSLVGNAELEDARFSVRDQPLAVRAFSGRAEFSEARVLIQDAHGVLNDGRFTLRGDVRMSEFALKHVELGAVIESVTLRPAEDVDFKASGELLFFGRPDAYTLSGELDIIRLKYEKPIVIDSLLAEVKQQGRGSAEKPKDWLTFDVDLKASGDVRVDNNLARAKLLGKVKLTGTNLRPGLLGTIETAEGSQAFFRNNQFAVTKGELQFNQRYAIEAFLEFSAQAQVRDYLVTLRAFGRMSDPKVVLSSEPALSEADILSLLTLGVTSRDRELTSESGYGLLAEGLFTASGLDRQVQKFLPKSTLLRDLSFHLSTTYNDASGLVEPSAQFESKFLTEQLKLKMTRPISGKGTRAQAEYRFDNRLSVQGQWDNEYESAFGNPGLALKLRWELE